MVVTLTTSQNPEKQCGWVGGCRVTPTQPPFSSMLVIGFTGPSSILNHLFFIGFITPAKEEGPICPKKLVQNHSRKGRSTAHDAIPYSLVLQEIWDLSSAPSSSTSPNTYQNYVPYVYYLVYDKSSLPYLLSFQVTRKEKMPMQTIISWGFFSSPS